MRATELERGARPTARAVGASLGALWCALAVGCSARAGSPDNPGGADVGPVSAQDAAAQDAAAQDAAAQDAAALDDAALTDAASTDAGAEDAARVDAPGDARGDTETPPPDVGSTLDAGPTADVGASRLDAGSDAGADAGPARVDAGAALDAGLPVDARGEPDGSTVADAGGGALPVPPGPPFGWAPASVIERREDGGQLIDDRRTDYTYDTARRVSTSTWLVPDAGRWRPNQRTTWRYDVMGRVAGRDIDNYVGGAWVPAERDWVDYDAMGRVLVDHHGVLDSRGAVVEAWRYVWEWDTAGRPQWRRFWQRPSGGGELYYSSYHAFQYDTAGRLIRLGRGDRGSPTGSFSDAGNFAYVSRPSGHLHTETFTRGSRTNRYAYGYDLAGRLAEQRSDTSLDRYVLDGAGRLRFIQTWLLVGGGWSLTREVELTHTDAGSSYTFTLDPHPLQQWMQRLYARGDLVDRYRR